MAEPLIASQDASLPVVNQYRIPDRVECVLPLLLNRVYLFEQTHVLQRHSQQVGNVQQVGEFVRLKPHSARRPHRNHSKGPFLPRERQRYQRFQSSFCNSLPRRRILLLVGLHKLAVPFQDLLHPRFCQRNFRVPRQERFPKSNRRPHRQLR
jgi:hypothetical protein